MRREGRQGGWDGERVEGTLGIVWGSGRRGRARRRWVWERHGLWKKAEQEYSKRGMLGGGGRAVRMVFISSAASVRRGFRGLGAEGGAS